MKKFLKRIGALALAVMYIAIYLVVSVLVSTAYAMWQSASKGTSLAEIQTKTVNNTFALSVIATVITFWIYLIIWRIRKKSVDEIINNNKQPFAVLGMAGCLAIGMRLLVTVYYHYSQNIEMLNKSIDSAAAITPELTSNAQLMVAVVSTVIIAPLFEEFLFRGILMYELKKVMRPWAAIAVQGILFGIVHGVLFQSIFAAVMGIILGVVYHNTKSLKTSVVCHGVFNLSVVLTQAELNTRTVVVFVVMGMLLSVFSMIYILKSNRE